ncbi:uncharacterized protein LOC119107914 [Pollicipes pollicipes]|uniref:uncharacterized protein LOC119107914 n=1 Tax=Pollicipes pollicipes TaxID=41117 RepID=UPI0018856E70|nr:uncharacterized protein LOC119107914 [Pollicipes pollicipes]
MTCCNPADGVGWERPAGCSSAPPPPCPGADPCDPVGTEGPPFDATHPAALCPGPPGVPCPHVPDTGPGPGVDLPPCPARPGLLTAQQIGHQRRGARDMATDAVRARLKYETLPDHLEDLAFSEILQSDRFKSTATVSYTSKSRDRCLNPEPIFSLAPPSGDVTYLKETEERVRQSTLPASRPRFSEYGEAYHPRRLSCADMVGQVKLKKPIRYMPSTDVLPKHFYTAEDGVAGEVNPYLSTTRKDFKPVSAAAAKYRDPPSTDTFTGDLILPAEAQLQPRWHGFTPVVPHTGLQSEAQARFCRPRLDDNSRHNWTLPVEAPLVIPPTTRQLFGEALFDQESINYGTGRHNPVALSCRGLVTQQRHRRELCNLQYEEPQPSRPPCCRTGPLATRGPVDDAELRAAPISLHETIGDNHFGLTPHPPQKVVPDVN